MPLADWENVILTEQKTQFSAGDIWKKDQQAMEEKPHAEFNKAPGAPIRERSKSQLLNPFPPSIHHQPSVPMANGYGQINDGRNDYRASYDFAPSQNQHPPIQSMSNPIQRPI